MSRRRAGTILLGAALSFGAAPRATAQNPPPPDTSAAPATAPSTPPLLSIPPFEIATGPLPPGSRLTFARDSVLWTAAYTLADLLAEVPGVYVARSGFVGQPAAAFYGGRGPAGLEILWDGIPMLPLGPDSVSVDPGRISLFGIRSVEVERLPGLLRVRLVSERNAVRGSRSQLRIVNGDFRTGGYAGLFQQRWANGVGLDLLADYFSTEGDRNPPRNARWFDLRAKVDWSPSPNLSASAQVRQLTFARTATVGSTGSAIPTRDDFRTETLIRVVASSRPERQGLSLEAGLQTTAWHADSGAVDTILGSRTVHRAFLGLRATGRRATADLLATAGDHYTPVSAALRLGWLPLSWVVLAGDGSWARHDGDRTSLRGHAALSLFWRSLSLVGEATVADAVPAPMLVSDTTQQTADVGARLGVASRRISLHAGLERRDAFAPPGVPNVPDVDRLPPSPAATYAVSDATVTIGPIALSGWFAHPVGGSEAAFDPPRHTRASLTFRSKFWRTFRSGAFDIKAQVSLESWSSGIAGLDAAGTPIPLPGATISDAFLQIELVSFRLFYNLRNAFASPGEFVPGLRYPQTVQSFGVKWTFLN